MKPKLFLLFCWLCLLPAAAAAQQPGTVYLQDDGFIRGRITERPDGGVLLVPPAAGVASSVPTKSARW